VTPQPTHQPTTQFPFVITFLYEGGATGTWHYTGDWTGALLFAKQREEVLNKRDICEIKSIEAI